MRNHNHECLYALDFDQHSEAAPGKESGIFVVNFSSKPVYLTEGQTVLKAGEHLLDLM